MQPTTTHKQSKKARLQAAVDPVLLDQWTQLQEQMKTKLILTDDFKRDDGGPVLDSADLQNSLKLIGALDISYSKTDE